MALISLEHSRAAYSADFAMYGSAVALSGVLIFTLVFLPALLLGSLWRACALTLGLLTGYLAYAVTHHAAPLAR